MIRKLFERSFVIHRQMSLSYFVARRIQCPSSSFYSFTPIIVAPTIQRVQRLKFSTECNKNVGAEQGTVDNVEPNPMVIALSKTIQCSISEATEVHAFLSARSETVDLEAITKTIKWLNRLGAKPDVIVDNCHILLISLDRLKGSYNTLSRSKWQQVDHYVPLLAISESKINSIQMSIVSRTIFRDRIYFLSERFSIEPQIISRYCSKHLFMFEIDLGLLNKKLDMLLNFNVSPENILRDLNVLARHVDVIENRLEHLKMSGIDHIMPWMIKCRDTVLKRAIEIRNELLTQKKTMELLTKRLRWHGNTAKSMFKKNQFLRDLNADVATQLLDELSKIFTPKQISANITLLSHPLSHVEARVAELTSLGAYHQVPLGVLNMSDDSFREYLDNTRKSTKVVTSQL